MSERDGENFLTRWARLKRQSAVAPQRSDPPEPQQSPGEAGTDAAAAQSLPASAGAGPSGSARAQAGPSEADFADFDWDSLDATSDYTRFMQPGVPEAIRQQALRKLWTSDPVLAMPDALNDYMGDYTDAAVAVPANLLRTAYKVGRGFLDDSEVAAWDELGRPARPAPAPVAAAGDTPTIAPTSPDASRPAPEPEGETIAAGREEPAGSSTTPEETEPASAETAARGAAPGRSQG
jgi:hypothetical protein